jgi:hypothetical protein
MRDMRVSWHDHSIMFDLDGSFSSIFWLHKNIGTMKELGLTIGRALPENLLQDLLKAGR